MPELVFGPACVNSLHVLGHVLSLTYNCLCWLPTRSGHATLTPFNRRKFADVQVMIYSISLEPVQINPRNTHDT